MIDKRKERTLQAKVLKSSCIDSFPLPKHQNLYVSFNTIMYVFIFGSHCHQVFIST